MNLADLTERALAEAPADASASSVLHVARRLFREAEPDRIQMPPGWGAAVLQAAAEADRPPPPDLAPPRPPAAPPRCWSRSGRWRREHAVAPQARRAPRRHELFPFET